MPPKQRPQIKETDLYAPIKAHFLALGFEVKAEVADCDVVALKPGDEVPTIIELKTSFTLALIHQAIARLRLTDKVYVAVPRGRGAAWLRAHRANKVLCRRLGLGYLSVRLKDGFVDAHTVPGPYAPRRSKPKIARLVKEFQARDGDPNTGGMTGQTIVTAYRQDAERCRDYLAEHGPTKGAEVAKATGVARATTLMRDNHYGWFERRGRGVYGLVT